MFCRGWLLSVCLVVGTIPAQAADPAKFFEEKVRPVLVEHCQECHGPAKQKGSLRVDSREALLAGGDLGPSLVPGKPEMSRLIEAVHQSGDLKMPPKGKLKPQQIADLEAWVKQGAVWPGTIAPAPKSPSPNQPKGELPWSLRPRTQPNLPNVSNPGWVRNPIDQFILAKLDAKGLKPAPMADRRTLIRRVTYDLTGLPPTPQEIDAFLNDQSPDAYTKLIERLLASPAYGERWGRHWLDVARYADSNGMDENLAHALAYRYRDWVIDAFNRDMPFDRFLQSQIAGDLLDPNDPSGIVATGFLMIGPKMLAEDDPVKMQMDIIDEQLDTIGQAMLGMTIGCARCHDHKFDPISMADYYGLAGILKSTKTMNSFSVVAQWHERPIALPAERDRLVKFEAELNALKGKLTTRESELKQKILEEARKKVDDYIAAAEEVRSHRKAKKSPPMMAGKMQPKDAIVVQAESFARGNVQKDHEHYGKGIGVLVNAGPLPNFTEYDVAITEAGSYWFEVRYAAADARPTTLIIDGKDLGAVAMGTTGGWFPEQQKWERSFVVNLKPQQGKVKIRLERTGGPVPHIDQFALIKLAPGETASRTDAQIAKERSLRLPFVQQWATYLDRQKSLPTGDARTKLLTARDGPFAYPKPADLLYTPDELESIKVLREPVSALEAKRPATPMAMAVDEGKPENLKIHIRGSHLTLGNEVARGFPKSMNVPGGPTSISSVSGRKELAQWITRPDHPLTARVAVNRLWLWHFGDGLVRTPDNFGRLGEMPDHPELLDWLANQFVASGWSVRNIHRLILTSATYQQSSAYDAKAALTDPDNRLRWRWSRQRLDAESLRDSLLAMGGMIDRTAGGTLLKTADRAYVNSAGGRNYDGADSVRRSVYLPVVRSGIQETLQAWDFPDPSVPAGRRPVTTVPPQALLMMNAPLVAKATKGMAERLLASGSSDTERIEQAYRLIYGRSATAGEAERARQFLDRYTAALKAEKIAPAEHPLRAWQGLCRVLVSTNEFIYVE